MDFFTVAAIIVFIACATAVALNYIKAKNKPVARELEARLTHLEHHVENSSLERRVEALEKIVTDGNSELKQRINEL